MNPKIFIVIPVYNRLAFTKKCLASVFSQTYKNYQVILIDDGSTDGTSEYISKKYPTVKIIRGNGKWWWTKSMAKGVIYALSKGRKDDFVLEMNNDCFFNPDYFKNLLNVYQKYPNSLIGSLNVRADRLKEVVEAGIRIDWPTGLVYGVAQTISNRLNYYLNMEIIDNLDALPGKGTLIPFKVFNKIGNFNAKWLPHYIADYEFANRAKRKGYNLIVSTKAIVKHHWEATGIYSTALNKRVSYKRAYLLLLSRKSMNNIVDWVVFLFLSCPRKYLARNIFYSFLKVIKAVLTVYPFLYLRPLLKCLLTGYWHSKLVLYKVYLYVVQFPQYHLKKK